MRPTRTVQGKMNMSRCIPWTSILLALAAGSAETVQQIPLERTLHHEDQPARGSNSTGAPQELVVADKVVGRRIEAKLGEICLVCNQPIRAGDATYLVKGQRVPIHLGECDRQLRADPQNILPRLRPRGAFLGAGHDELALSNLWFFAGLYVVLGMIFAALCAHRALHAGHSPVAWFGVGLALHAFGYLLLLTRPKREIDAPAGVPPGLCKIAATHPPQPCPGCGAANHPSAGECIGCGQKLQPAIESEVKRVGLRTS